MGTLFSENVVQHIRISDQLDGDFHHQSASNVATLMNKDLVSDKLINVIRLREDTN